MPPYLIIDVTESLYYHQSETKMADSSEEELSDSSGNLSVVLDEDFEVSSSSEHSLGEDELEIEHGSAVSRPLSFWGPEPHLKFPANSDLRINQYGSFSFLLMGSCHNSFLLLFNIRDFCKLSMSKLWLCFITRFAVVNSPRKLPL